MMSLWDALRMNMMISYQELVRTFLNETALSRLSLFIQDFPYNYLWFRFLAIKEYFLFSPDCKSTNLSASLFLSSAFKFLAQS